MRIKTLFTIALIIAGLFGLSALSEQAFNHIDQAESAIVSTLDRAR